MAEVRDGAVEVRDVELVAMVAAGSIAAFEKLYQRHKHAVQRFSTSLLGCVHAAEDVTQETFTALWRNGARYSAEHGSLRTWLCAIAHHRAVDSIRDNARHARGVAAAKQMVASTEPLGPLAQAIARDEAVRLCAEVAQLPALQRQSIVLAFGGDLSHAEVATRTGVPLGTVKSRIRVGTHRMARCLDGADWLPGEVG